MTPKVSSLLVVMPSYFDLQTASELVREIRELAPMGVRVSCLIVDESLGRDSDWNRNEEAVLLELDSRVGAQMAVVSALRASEDLLEDHDCVCVMDSDGEDAPCDVWRLMKSLESSVDLVLAERGKRHAPIRFRMAYRCFQALHWIATGRIIRTGAFCLIRTSWLLKQIRSSEFNFSFNGAILQLEKRSRRVKCDRQQRRQGNSRLGISGSTSDAMRILLSQVTEVRRRWAKLVVPMVGLTVLLSSYWIIGSEKSSLFGSILAAFAAFLAMLCLLNVALLIQVVEISGGDRRSTTPVRRTTTFTVGEPPKVAESERGLK